MFDKLFSWGKKKAEDPAIPFGRYSDNNKTVAKVDRWTEADNLFKKQQYPESLEAFFDYLRDEAEQNVMLERNGTEGRFHLYQGSKIVRGEFNNERVVAEVTLARMGQPSVPVMRRLLEMNFNLYYSRYALDSDRLCMRFDSNIKSANPNKLYYGLKELAIKADKLDDLLVQEFTSLQSIDSDHVAEIPDSEKEIRYDYFTKWVQETIDYAASLDADKFSGAISYLLLTLAFRIDYMIGPEGKLQLDLEKVIDIYFKKDEKQTTERNQAMIEAYRKLITRPKEEVFPCLFRSKHTFSIVAPQNHKAVIDAINAAAGNMIWYRDNQYPMIANTIIEYGFSFCQYSYSLPKPLTDLFRLFMQINHADYFAAMGFASQYYDKASNEFEVDAIRERIEDIVAVWKNKFTKLEFKVSNLRYDNLVNFNTTFTAEVTALNFD
ncbi:hypothetical protein [Paraflavitalea sp. CAU 1676]|uniref:hypothetical protein n=1 Tax=Paraflavitalea sp. CAU 1676 TaxID=3032598 RepID=UPI0023DB354B|nr:hypothetical protein [Paraflavitalea sp. CAU 1676]MDF2191045.1 hypothetical protein [Paraflavitalea sp. CAU 1676]